MQHSIKKILKSLKLIKKKVQNQQGTYLTNKSFHHDNLGTKQYF